MKQLLKFIFSHLVEHPDEVEVSQESLEEGTDLFKVKINPEDMGQAIGKGGRIIKSVRQLSRVIMAVSGTRGVIQLVEPEVETASKE